MAALPRICALLLGRSSLGCLGGFGLRQLPHELKAFVACSAALELVQMRRVELGLLWRAFAAAARAAAACLSAASS